MRILSERLISKALGAPALLRDVVLPAVLVLVASGFALLLREAGDRRLSLVFLMPVLFGGFAGGIRAGLIAAVLSYLVYDLFVVPPYLSLFTATARDGIALVVFATAAIVTGLGSGALRDEQRRAAERSKAILTLLETSSFFTITPNVSAIRRRLAVGLAAITGWGAVVTDGDGRIVQRVGAGEDWVGGLEGELSELARAAMAQERGVAAFGRFRARAVRAAASAAPLGAAVWLVEGKGRTRATREREQHIALLLELAAAAIARAQREIQAQTQATLQDR